MITDEQLRGLSEQERDSLARRLAMMSAAEPAEPAPYFPRRRWFIAAVVVACAALSAWMFALSERLPSRYVVGHWDAAWIGFDSMLLISIAAVGWAAWRRAEALPIASLITAVLLICDAWFDVMTATGDVDVTASVVLAGVFELPLAAGMIYLAHRRHSRRAR